MSDYLTELFSLDGLTAVVTGGSSGIGLAVATALGRAGAEVVIVARGLEALDVAVESLRGVGAVASHVAADLARSDEVQRAVDAVSERVGVVDILVNCAGVNLRPPLPDLTDDVWRTTMALNLTAPFLLGQAFGPPMAAQGWGRIVNVGSQQSLSAFGNSGAYGVSKAAVAGLSRSQAEAWSPAGVCSNTLVPGFVVTPMTQHVVAEPGREAELAARTMVGRNGVPADFAGAAVFLASRASAYVTGQLLFVDGGFAVH